MLAVQEAGNLKAPTIMQWLEVPLLTDNFKTVHTWHAQTYSAEQYNTISVHLHTAKLQQI
jgi:hypothetical protein